MINKIKVFVVDDSPIVRQAFIKIFHEIPEVQLFGIADNPISAMQRIDHIGKPDVMILDLEMPKMNGLAYLKKIMSEPNPFPVIICSSVVGTGKNHNAIKALSLGAVDVIAKPKGSLKDFFKNHSDDFIRSIKGAVSSKIDKYSQSSPSLASTPKIINSDKRRKCTNSNSILSDNNLNFKISNPVISIGASTGGVQILEEILTSLEANTPPILIVQHMPAGFTASFSNRLNDMCKMKIVEAKEGMEIVNGTVYIAEGNKHMLVQSLGNKLYIKQSSGPKVSRHRPSVDALFDTVAKNIGAHNISFILTGMGDDGARGIGKIKKTGGMTYAQEECSCIVYGMPKVAVAMNSVNGSLSVAQMIKIIKNQAN
jgi:two-component system chemotaxis response regulator CheB